MKDCVFCQIVKGETETKIEKETENLVVFKDINPQAAIHMLIVPKEHIKDVTEVDKKVWEEMRELAVAMAREKGVKGFKLIHNAGTSATIPHMQMHFLADIAPERAM